MGRVYIILPTGLCACHIWVDHRFTEVLATEGKSCHQARRAARVHHMVWWNLQDLAQHGNIVIPGLPLLSGMERMSSMIMSNKVTFL